jgi:hypothetical protein
MPPTQRAVLILRTSGQPLCDAWTPSLHPGELEAANERLACLPYCWRWADPSPDTTP